MGGDFTAALDQLLARPPAERRARHETSARTPAPDAHQRREQARAWFAQFARDRIMPLFAETVAAVEKHGARARCALRQAPDIGFDRFRAVLQITPAGLPADAPPPQLSIAAGDTDHQMAIDYAGTFPSSPDGEFGAEIGWDVIYPAQLEQTILHFVASASGG